jgi:DNA-binding transcriptional regulator YdaS (Cro superfamily)
MNTKDVIQLLGGPAAIARRIGVQPQAISLWSAAGRVPLERVPALLQMARQDGVALTAADIRSDFDWSSVCSCEPA